MQGEWPQDEMPAQGTASPRGRVASMGGLHPARRTVAPHAPCFLGRQALRQLRWQAHSHLELSPSALAALSICSVRPLRPSALATHPSTPSVHSSHSVRPLCPSTPTETRGFLTRDICTSPLWRLRSKTRTLVDLVSGETPTP